MNLIKFVVGNGVEENHFAGLVDPAAFVSDVTDPVVIMRIGVQVKNAEHDSEDQYDGGEITDRIETNNHMRGLPATRWQRDRAAGLWTLYVCPLAAR